MTNSPRIIFMGTASFAVPSLEILIENGYTVNAVVTAPDRPAGRGRKIQHSPVKDAALKLQIPVLQPEKLKNPDFLNQLDKLNPDIIIVVAFRMLPEVIWKLPKSGTFNLHASLLPQFRGAAPINHAIIQGKKETGVTTFFIDDKIDTGKIIFQEKVKIGDTVTAGELHDRLMVEGAKLVLKTVQAIQNNAAATTEQSSLIEQGEKLLPAPKIFREDCKIDWNKPAEVVHNFIRGLSPVPGAFCFFTFKNEKRKSFKIFRSTKMIEKTEQKPGDIVVTQSVFKVKCADGFISVDECQLEGKKKMDIHSFLAGFNAEEFQGIE